MGLLRGTTEFKEGKTLKDLTYDQLVALKRGEDEERDKNILITKRASAPQN
jgi:hypothetical protein